MFAFVRHFFKLQFLLIVIAILVGVYYDRIVDYLLSAPISQQDQAVPVHYESVKTTSSKETLFSKTQLAQFNGENGQPIYLALLGHVYDVTKGAKHYGNGCSYNYFVGRDASLSFITGEFDHYDEATADDVLQLKSSELLSLDTWKQFYDKEYTYKGKLIGRFYDATGEPTVYQHKYKALVDQARLAKASSEQLRSRFPDCNIEWSAETGTHVWCTTSSGGKERSWQGFPRKLFQVGSDDYRCACVRTEELDTKEFMLKEYENCDGLSHDCYYKVA